MNDLHAMPHDRAHDEWISFSPRPDLPRQPQPGVGENPGSLQAEAGQAVGSSTPAEARPSFARPAGEATVADAGMVWNESNVLPHPGQYAGLRSRHVNETFVEACEAMRRDMASGKAGVSAPPMSRREADESLRAAWADLKRSIGEVAHVEEINLGDATLPREREPVDYTPYWMLGDDGSLCIGSGDEMIRLDPDQTRRLANMLTRGVAW